jgi:rieske iron-sulfur protein
MSETKCQSCLVATRRKVLTVASVLALDATGSLTRRARAEPADDRPKQGDVLVAIDSGASAAALTPSAVAVDARPIIAWPMDPVGNVVRDGSRLNKVLVLRLDPATLSEETRARAADGIVAYSAICPHAGCEVSGWNEQQAVLECSCHASHYNPRDAAAVIDGPTPRPLPALPLAVSDGKLVVAKTFTSRPGIVHS